MELELSIDGVVESVDVAPNESLLAMLRRQGHYSVKQGCETGECGACTVLVDGMPRPSCVMLVAQAGGCALTTVESLGSAHKLHPLQEAFVDTGAVQCGFCTAGMLLSAYALLKGNPSPTQDEVRDALSGNLCRCSGYIKPVQAVMRAAAMLRSEQVSAILPPTQHLDTQVVGKPVPSVDALKLVTGRPAFTDDITIRGMLHGRLLTSPHAHAVIREIDVARAKALPGVHVVLTYKDVPRVAYSSVERAPSEGGPHDRYSLDSTLRYMGDRVAAVAAETPEIAEQAIQLIEVNYDVLPAILDPRQALAATSTCLHPESESSGIYDASHNIAARVHSHVGDVERGFADSDLIIEDEYVVAAVQQAPLENHTVITYFDEDNYLVVRTSTQVPYHVRRTLAPIVGLPARRIRVLKPNVGNGFASKQEIVLEDICALLTITTSRPVRMVYSRADDFRSSSCQHAHTVHLKTGVKRDGTIVANQLTLLASTGAYGTHQLATTRNTPACALLLYPCPSTRFIAQILYTNLPPAVPLLGYGTPYEFFALECHMDKIANQLGMDALELRRKNCAIPSVSAPRKSVALERGGLSECVRVVEEMLQWKEKRGTAEKGRYRHGVGVALALHSSAVAGATESSAAMLKLNEDGSFDVFAGATQSETLLAQIAAEVLGVPMEDVLMYPCETRTTLSDTGTSAILSASGNAVKKAAEQAQRQILAVAGRMLGILPEKLKLKGGMITAPNGQTLTVAQVASHALYVENRHIIATASWKGQPMPPSFAAQGVEVEVDTETGIVRVLKAITAVDAGRVINPLIAEGQLQGSMAQALGASICEELIYDQQGKLLTPDFSNYHIYTAPEMPEMHTAIVETGGGDPFGAKSVAEVARLSLAPAIANAVGDALGVRIRQLPLTPERVLRAIHAQTMQR